MKIKWIGSLRRVKGLGWLNEGFIIETDKTTGNNLIKQGLAVKDKTKRKQGLSANINLKKGER